jgi:hypothetical protein
MRWYHYVAYFFGGAFLANAVPHLGNGMPSDGSMEGCDTARVKSPRTH